MRSTVPKAPCSCIVHAWALSRGSHTMTLGPCIYNKAMWSLWVCAKYAMQSFSPSCPQEEVRAASMSAIIRIAATIPASTWGPRPGRLEIIPQSTIVGQQGLESMTENGCIETMSLAMHPPPPHNCASCRILRVGDRLVGGSWPKLCSQNGEN